MKTVFNIVLVLCAAALIYICYTGTKPHAS